MSKRVKMDKPKTFYRWLTEDRGWNITRAEANRLWTVCQNMIPPEVIARGIRVGK